MNEKDCKYEGCTRYPVSHGLCDGHRAQVRRGKGLRPLRDRTGQLFCSFSGCERKHHARSFCWSHYKQQQRGMEPKEIRKWVRKQTKEAEES
jgi:hypothetical protein